MNQQMAKESGQDRVSGPFTGLVPGMEMPKKSES